jgi:hypothetical protein
MTEARFFNFTKEDYTELETITFDEDFQRDEKVRFYTLEEQILDAFEKLIPKGKIAKFKIEKIKQEVDRIKALYEKFVEEQIDTYTLREPEYSKRFNWIFPVHSPLEFKPYNWETELNPLFSIENAKNPNFYKTMLASLPRPYVKNSEGAPVSITDTTRMLDQTGGDATMTLGNYIVPHSQYHEDKTLSIVRVPASGTADDVNFIGYYLMKRQLGIPNPLDGHDFFKSADEAYIPSIAPLEDIVPSLDAILTHGVPVTPDPYGTAMQFLKIYDVKLTDIPWNNWKRQFPQVEVINNKEIPAPIQFSEPEKRGPPEKITNLYTTQYDPGLSVRKWLMERVDGGAAMIHALRSIVSDNGSVESIPGIDVEPAAYPDTTIEECRLTEKSFPDFKVTGILRRTWKEDKIKKDTYAVLQCVPLEFIRQERARVGYLDRISWDEATGQTINTEYGRRLVSVTPITMFSKKDPPRDKAPTVADSPLREGVLAIQHDDARTLQDKFQDIPLFLKDVSVVENIYKDSNGAFVFCNHTLALLGGELIADRRAYYDKWCVLVEGDRTCRFCGQVVNQDVFENQVEFDSNKKKISHQEALDEKAVYGESIARFTTGLAAIRKSIVEDNPHDETVILLFSILQVLPTIEQFNPILTYCRKVADGMSAAFKKSNRSPDYIKMFRGAAGIATTALILQIHVPPLVPQRSFGPRPLNFSGYPRDSEEPGEFSIVDVLISVMRKTFEGLSKPFKGASTEIIRNILSASAETKKVILSTIKTIKTKRKSDENSPVTIIDLLEKAKKQYAEFAPTEAPTYLIPVLPPPKELGTITSFEKCPGSRMIWTSGRIPSVIQAVVPLLDNMDSSNQAIALPVAQSSRVGLAKIEPSVIRSRLAIKPQSTIELGKSPRLDILLASRIADTFLQPTPLRSIERDISESLFKNIAEGFAREQIKDAEAIPVNKEKLNTMKTKDLSMFVLLSNYSESKKLKNTLRAKERTTIVERLSEKSDAERQVTQSLMAIGLAQFILTNKDRESLAESERIRELLGDTGVGLPRDPAEDGEEVYGGDDGDYGNLETRAVEGGDSNAAATDTTSSI